MKQKFATERYLSEISYYKYRSAFGKFRISAHSFLIDKGRWSSVPGSKRYYPLCLGITKGIKSTTFFTAQILTSLSSEKLPKGAL